MSITAPIRSKNKTPLAPPSSNSVQSAMDDPVPLDLV